LLDTLRRGQRWLILFVVIVIGFVFAFYLGTGGGLGSTTPTGNAVVQLDEIRLTGNDLQRERAEIEDRLRAELGDAYDQLGADKYLEGQALSRMVNQLVLAEAARELGLQVTKEEIRRVVQQSPVFIDDQGRFNPEAFDGFAQQNFGSQQAFMETFTRDLLGQKLIQLLAGQTSISDAEIDLQIRYELEDVILAYAAFDKNQLRPDAPAVTDAEVEAWAAAHDGELRELFATREAELSLPERVHARHILATVASEANEADLAAARERAQKARDRVIAGEDFAAVAQEVSNDPATAPSGGDLGTFARGLNDPALDDAAFALESGGVSDVVRSIHGFHVIRVDEKFPAEPATFEAHRLALAREGATRERASKLAEEGAAALAREVESGKTLEEAAQAAGIDLERPASLKRRQDGFVPGLGAAGELLTTAFTLEPGQASPRVFDLEDKRVLIQVLARTRIGDDEIASQREARREQARVQKQNETVQAWLDDYRTRLERSGRLLINSELALGS
jgi:peptidyl-prolyl cis-trans isomerase D